MTSSPDRRRSAVAALAIAAGLVLAPVAASPAHAGAAASAVLHSTDAAAQPALHVGVRQAAVGDPIPVTIVGAEAGAVWEVAIASPETVVGTVTIGDDGTGTTMVSLPLGTDAGSVEFTASAGGRQISSSLSSAGDTTAGEAEAPATAADEPAATVIATPVVIGIVAAAALGLAGIVTFFTLRRRRGASA
ncbi:hypothetical protein ASD56_02790 [Microbacterium sp. Root166]|uniref:hypothetical protein n=1 Tax=Microbacterium sp. Root166 TaxID=1736478 RepID=UPI00070034A5|nr:hypothetical protein [Microbacterium sp. Root166]KQZ85298.1 hypothetical protein ASD56_02790 [Microbacterium sp. Root166]